MLYAFAANAGSFLATWGVIALILIILFVGYCFLVPYLAASSSRLERLHREKLQEAERWEIRNADLPSATKKAQLRRRE